MFEYNVTIQYRILNLMQSFLTLPGSPTNLQINSLFIFLIEYDKSVYNFFRDVSIQIMSMHCSSQIWIHHCIVGLSYGFIVFSFVEFAKIFDQVFEVFDILLELPSAMTDIVASPFNKVILNSISDVLIQYFFYFELLVLLPLELWVQNLFIEIHCVLSQFGASFHLNNSILIIIQHRQNTIQQTTIKQTMSKKGGAAQKKQKQIQQKLTMLSACSQIHIKIPSYLSNPSIDQLMLKQYIKAKVFQKKKVCKKQPISVTIFGKEMIVWIKQLKKIESLEEKMEERDKYEVKYDEVLVVNPKTEFFLVFQEQLKQNEEESGEQEDQKNVLYGDISQYQSLKNTIVKNFQLRKVLSQVKLGAIKGIIIGGATGTGKTTYVNMIRKQLSSKERKCLQISSTHLLSRVVGGAEEYVRKTFRQLSEFQSAVFIIQDLHLLFGQKEVASHETTLATLFSQMDNFDKPLIVIGTYNSDRQLSRSVYQSGRFQKQIILNLPNHHQRLDILKQMLGHMGIREQKMSEEEIKQFNLRLNGYSVGQIKQILRDAYILKGDQIQKDDLFHILKKYRPSQMKELIVEVPEVYWSGIGGYQQVKKQIRKVTQFPLKHPQKFKLMNIQPSKGVLLYGPPGCSKTMMAKAIATESKLNFIGIKGPELFSKYVGQSERAIRSLFRKARAFSPCIIFFDQIDALASQRTDQSDVTNRVLGQLLTEMDGVEGLKEVVIIAATNRPQILDEALTRPGRFDHLIYVGPPDYAARKQIFQICLQKSPLQGNLSEIAEQFAKSTDKYTGAQITLLCRQSALEALEDNIQEPLIRKKNLQAALNKIKNRLNQETIARYESFSARFKKTPEQSKSVFSSSPNIFAPQKS